jgi:predicted TIM-barrel fold metal-dependent hydrolase
MELDVLRPNLPFLNDKESDTIPTNFPAVIDAHVHVFPGSIFNAIRKWFDAHAWHIRYQLTTSEIFDFMLSHGVTHIIALQYAHKPGIASGLNQYMVEQCRQYADQVTGMATVLPGEKDAGQILQDAFDAGLSGLKLHAHVQCFEINSDDTYHLFDICQSNRKPVLVHIGKEPKSTAYRCDPYQICGVDKLEQVLTAFPKLKICVPHLGFNEIHEYKQLIEAYDTLWLDTTMALTDYFDIPDRIALNAYRTERLIYGSDFPNIPYAWDRELIWLRDAGLTEYQLERILNRNATEFYNLDA